MTSIETRRFVRHLDGRFILTIQTNHGSTTRPLSLGERILWRLARRTPRT